MNQTFKSAFFEAAKPRLHNIHRGFTRQFLPEDMEWMFRRIDYALKPLSQMKWLPDSGTYRTKVRCMGRILSIYWTVDDTIKYPKGHPWFTQGLWIHTNNTVGLNVKFPSYLAAHWKKHKRAFRTAVGCVLAHEMAHSFQKNAFLRRGLLKLCKVNTNTISYRVRSNTGYRIVSHEFFADVFATAYMLWRHPHMMIHNVLKRVMLEMTDDHAKACDLLAHPRYKKRLSIYWKVS